MAISHISDTEKLNIKNKSAFKLPTNPSKSGLSVDTIKKALWQPTDEVIDKINEVIDDINTEFETRPTETDLKAHTNSTANPHSVSKAQVGLGNVDDTADLNKPISTAVQNALNLKANLADISNIDNTADLDKPISTAVQSALDLKANLTAISNINNTADLDKPISTATQIALNAKADLENGKIPSSQLPSYVDDVAEYNGFSNFPTTGESGKIYIDTATNLSYRWGGTAYTALAGGSMALGETSSTAYRGDRGKIAYDHTLNTANPHGVTAEQIGAVPTSVLEEFETTYKADYVTRTYTSTPETGGLYMNKDPDIATFWFYNISTPKIQAAIYGTSEESYVELAKIRLVDLNKLNESFTGTVRDDIVLSFLAVRSESVVIKYLENDEGAHSAVLIHSGIKQTPAYSIFPSSITLPGTTLECTIKTTSTATAQTDIYWRQLQDMYGDVKIPDSENRQIVETLDSSICRYAYAEAFSTEPFLATPRKLGLKEYIDYKSESTTEFLLGGAY